MQVGEGRVVPRSARLQNLLLCALEGRGRSLVPAVGMHFALQVIALLFIVAKAVGVPDVWAQRSPR